MYAYDTYDQTLVDERVAQFRDQMQRHLAGQLPDDEFLPLRLQNGLYIQRHAPMLRIAIPYGTLASRQLRKLGEIVDRFDQGWGHFSTRCNLQLNNPRLEQVPDILAELATVQMHAIQTSGNCVRNTSTDHFAGVAPDEAHDPRPIAEIIRQWSTVHPEFAFLPRKFKIAITATPADRAAIEVHDVGLRLLRDDAGALRVDVIVGGGLGRTPVVGPTIRQGLPIFELLNYLEAVLRVYNRYGRRDNKFKARIKILVRALGAEAFAAEVERDWQRIRGGPNTLTQEMIDSFTAQFALPPYRSFGEAADLGHAPVTPPPGFAAWASRSVAPHRQPGHAAVSISLKSPLHPPGDCTGEQMGVLADLADEFSFGEIRVTHMQNLVLPHVEERALVELYLRLRGAGLATPNIGLLTDIIACPGGDWCALANAKSLPVAKAIQDVFADLDELFDIGDIELNISGCINSCGHHHVGHIGILGVDKAGEEWYQLSIGGSQGPSAKLGKILGPSFSREGIVDAVEKLVRLYLRIRQSSAERFLDTVERVGIETFREGVYEPAH